MNIKGKTAIVTGASAGIGRATALMLVQRGAAKIVVVDIDRAGLRSLEEEIRRAGATPFAKVADLSKPDEVIRLFEAADQETGGLDIVHNNAGVMTGQPDFPDTVMSKMIAVIQINLLAMMVGTRIAVEQMRRRKAPGVIINTSSIAAFSIMPADPAYSASKHGILAFSQSCKPLHERFGIRVMAICPGITDTAIVPKDAPWLQPALERVRILQPDDIAREVCRIVEDDTLSGDYVTVQNQEAAPA
ncbi:MAG: Short-chain dehydrogenase [Phenylobacterium sp.]|nr:Short-chain dehydrogenase [Phenylobacterium sp.]